MTGRRQKRVERETERLLRAGVQGRVFPGASAAVLWCEGDSRREVLAQAGSTCPGGTEVGPATLYDLASITKPIVATAALRMVADGGITLESRLEDVVSDVRGTLGGSATLEALLTHRAGLAAWGGLFMDVPHELGTTAAKRWLLTEAARHPHDEPDGAAVYSDMGYILAGEMLARAAGEPLDAVVARYVTDPLGLTGELFYPMALPRSERLALRPRIAPTERCEWRGEVVHGEPHDENCWALGGITGHAGLFGTARAVARFGRAVLDVRLGRSDFVRRELLERALAPRPGGPLRLGWNSRAGLPAMGRYLGQKGFGHLGFTGTSLWCDEERDLVVVLLTNRVHPTRANERIKGFRPAFHDGVVAAFDG